MILYFSGTGNSTAVGRSIAGATGERLVPMREAASLDLTGERVVGLVYPCYDFNTPPAVREYVSRLRISPDAYVFIVVTCGAQTGNSVWTVRRLLKRGGVEVAYCHKIRMPDNCAIVFGRNPNDQLWKLEKYASRLDRICTDIQARRRGNHYGFPGLVGWITGIPSLERRLLGAFMPKVDAERCVGCGVCETVCPVANISVSSTATLGSHCSSCLGCLHACPRQAIAVGGKPTLSERQYRHPDA